MHQLKSAPATTARTAKVNAQSKIKQQQASSDEEDFSLPSSIRDFSASGSSNSKKSSILNSANVSNLKKLRPFSSETQTFVAKVLQNCSKLSQDTKTSLKMVLETGFVNLMYAD
jgi:hypothetical protein